MNFPCVIDWKNRVNPVKKIPKEKKYLCNGINVQDYLTDEEIDNANTIVVMNNLEPAVYKGSGYIPPETKIAVIHYLLEGHERDYINHGDYVYIAADFEPFIWSFEEMTSSYSGKRDQHYIEVKLTSNRFKEMDLLHVASGLSYVYGTQFHIHTVNVSRKIYHLTIEDERFDYSRLTSGINGVKSRFADVMEIKEKVRRADSKEPNANPVPMEIWEW